MTLGDRSEWANMTDIMVHVLDSDGTLIEASPLKDREYDFSGNYFLFRDMDHNRGRWGRPGCSFRSVSPGFSGQAIRLGLRRR